MKLSSDGDCQDSKAMSRLDNLELVLIMGSMEAMSSTPGYKIDYEKYVIAWHKHREHMIGVQADQVGIDKPAFVALVEADVIPVNFRMKRRVSTKVLLETQPPKRPHHGSMCRFIWHWSLIEKRRANACADQK